MSSELATEVVIVGAGPTGLMLANDLARREIPFLLADRAESASTQSRALHLQSRSLEAFAALGVIETLLSKGVTISGVRSYNRGKVCHQFSLETVSRRDVPYPYLLVVEQHVVEAILTEQLRKKGVRIERGWELSRLSDDPDQVKSSFRTDDGERHVRSSYVVGCDGAYSGVRRAKGIAFSRGDSDIVYHLADLELSWEMPEQEIVWMVDGFTEIVATPLPGDKRYRLSMWTESSRRVASAEPDFGALETPLTAQEWETLLQRLAPCPVTLSNPRSLMCYRSGYGLAEEFISGRVILAGDSAHVSPQCAAQGLNFGIQDAHNLGWKLGFVLSGNAPQELLASYQDERRDVARAALAPPSREPSLMGRATYLESKDDFDDWSQLRLHYRHSPLTFSSSSKELLQAGDRAPDGELQGGEFLYDRLDGLNYHLLVFTDRHDPKVEILLQGLSCRPYTALKVEAIGLGPGATVDHEGGVHRAFEARHGDLIVVRPDGFIAARATLDEGEQLFDYLDRQLLPAESSLR